MPIYEYRCKKGHTFDELQRMTDEPLTECKVCGAPVQRVFHPVAVHFKGSGFYNTDYGKKKKAGAAAEPSSSKNDSKPESKKPETKKTESSSSSSD
jgi:putative FmdB family regulatory protein